MYYIKVHRNKSSFRWAFCCIWAIISYRTSLPLPWPSRSIYIAIKHTQLAWVSWLRFFWAVRPKIAVQIFGLGLEPKLWAPHKPKELGSADPGLPQPCMGFLFQDKYIVRVIRMIRLDRKSFILTAPLWPHLHWYPDFLQPESHHIYPLFLFPDLLSQQQRRILQPNLATLQFAVLKIIC